MLERQNVSRAEDIAKMHGGNGVTISCTFTLKKQLFN